MCLFEKKLTLYKEVAICSITFFKNSSEWYSEILFFSGIFCLITTVLALYVVNLQIKLVRMCSFEKSCHYLKSGTFLYNLFKNRS